MSLLVGVGCEGGAADAAAATGKLGKTEGSRCTWLLATGIAIAELDGRAVTTSPVAEPC